MCGDWRSERVVWRLEGGGEEEEQTNENRNGRGGSVVIRRNPRGVNENLREEKGHLNKGIHVPAGFSSVGVSASFSLLHLQLTPNKLTL
jgi:hypothetical protein